MPDDFLAVLKAHRRAPLKIYLGMAAGVGKTVAMLKEGKRLVAEGVDVACAIVETHGRAATLEESQGVELIPRKTLIYRGVPMEEMDLDAVLARKPAVALVDELAHTNVGGSKNEKRWQDVEELLDAGFGGAAYGACASRSRFTSNTLTRGSPKKPSVLCSVWFAINSVTLDSGTFRVPAMRGT